MTDWTSAMHGDGAYADVNGITLYTIKGSPLLAEAALAFLDAPGA